MSDLIYKCGLKEFCLRCGNCCRFRLIKSSLSDEEELQIRKVIFYKKSLLYPFPLSQITIAITSEEAKVLKEEAKRLDIALRLLPNKVLVIENNFVILDYFIDHDVCPSLDEKTNLCKIHEKRPKVCRLFPNKPKSEVMPDQGPLITFEQALKKFFEKYPEFLNVIK